MPQSLVAVGLSVAVICLAVGCVPSSDSSPLGRALLAAARDSQALGVGPSSCDDCSISVTNVRQSKTEPTFAAATLHVAYNGTGNQKTQLIFHLRGGHWRVVQAVDSTTCRSPIPRGAISVALARSLGVCGSGS